MLTVLTAENTLFDPINAKYRVMSPVSLVPEQDLHFVLCDFGRSGQAYVETDPTGAAASTIVRNLCCPCGSKVIIAQTRFATHTPGASA